MPIRSLRITAMLATILLAFSLAPPAFAKAQVPLGGVEIRGSGPIPMVLITGPLLDWRYWEDFMDRNGDKYTMYAVTLAGVGGTPAMPAPPLWRPPDRDDRKNPPLDTPWLDNAVDGIVDMMIEHETGPAVIVGHTLGGTLALRLGIEHPQLVSAVVTLEGGVAFPTPRPFTKKERAKDALWRYDQKLRDVSPEDWKALMAKWASQAASSPEIAEFITGMCLNTDQDIIIRYRVELLMTDLTDEIGKLRAPLLGIFALVGKPKGANEAWGKRIDNEKKAQFAPAWHEDIRFYEMGEISAYYNLKEPERFDAELAEFFRSQNITGAEEPTDPTENNPSDN